jgi:general secretion pathway protein J
MTGRGGGAMRTGARRGAPCGIPHSLLSGHSPFPIPDSRRATRAQGFTLLEVLASLALLGLLMLGVYAGVRIATRSVHVGTARVERLDQVRAAQQLLRRELAQAMAQTIDHDDQGVPLVFDGGARQVRYLAPLPGYLGQLGPQLQTLRLVNDGATGLRLELGLALLPPDGGEPRPVGEPQPLVDHVRAGRFSYRGVDARGRATPWLATWTDGRTLPRLVRVELQLDGPVSWPTLVVPLRADAGDAGSGASALPMRRKDSL